MPVLASVLVVSIYTVGVAAKLARQETVYM